MLVDAIIDRFAERLIWNVPGFLFCLKRLLLFEKDGINSLELEKQNYLGGLLWLMIVLVIENQIINFSMFVIMSQLCCIVVWILLWVGIKKVIGFFLCFTRSECSIFSPTSDQCIWFKGCNCNKALGMACFLWFLENSNCLSSWWRGTWSFDKKVHLSASLYSTFVSRQVGLSKNHFTKLTQWLQPISYIFSCHTRWHISRKILYDAEVAEAISCIT